MKWVKIEDGCEMPEQLETVLIFKECGYFGLCDYRNNDFHPIDENGSVCLSERDDDATHWARVELPEE